MTSKNWEIYFTSATNSEHFFSMDLGTGTEPYNKHICVVRGVDTVNGRALKIQKSENAIKDTCNVSFNKIPSGDMLDVYSALMLF